jgi:hypothetical protein
VERMTWRDQELDSLFFLSENCDVVFSDNEHSMGAMRDLRFEQYAVNVRCENL